MNRRHLAWVGAAGLAVLVAITSFVMRERAPEAPQPAPVAAKVETVPAAGAEKAGADKTVTTAPLGDAQPTPLEYRGYVIETGGNLPEACLQFSRHLLDTGAVNYADYIKVNGQAAPGLRVGERQLCVAGLAFGRTYQVELLSGLPARDEARLTEGQQVSVMLGDRPSRVNFAGRGFILPREGATGLALETVNVAKVRIKVIRIGDRILAQHVRRDWTSETSYWQVRQAEEQTGTVIWKGEMPVANQSNQTVTTAIPLADLLKPRRPGAYLVVAEDAARNVEDDPYDNASRAVFAAQWVIETDLALTTMRGADGLHVFVRSLDTAKPVAGAQVALIAHNNDELGRAATDDSGRAHFPAGLLRGTGGATPAAATAYAGDDEFSIIDLRRPAFDLSDRGVSGRATPGPLDAFLYTDRGIYRPGEMVQLVGMLRDDKAVAVADMPLTLVLARPDGTEARRFTATARMAGAVHQPIQLSDAAARGMWSVSAHVGSGEKPIGRVEFDVQDFVPQRLKVEARTAATVLKPGERIAIDVAGQFLYGAPAAGLTGESEIKIAPDPEPFPDYRGYRFGLHNARFEEVSGVLGMTETDAAGQTRAEGPLPSFAPTSIPLKATIKVGLFEPGGRLTGDALTLPVRQQRSFVGVKPRAADAQVRSGTDSVFDIVVLDEQGNPQARDGVVATFVEELWTYDWFYGDGRWNYRYVGRDRALADGTTTLTVGADRPAEILRRLPWGNYRLTVEDRAAGVATSLRFRVGWAASAETANTPDKVEVTVERERYKRGEQARVRVVPPFAGELMLAIATDRLVELRTQSVPAEGAIIELPVTPDWGTGAYVLAGMYRPLKSGLGREPVRAVGLTWVGIDLSDRTLAVTMGTPERVTPRQTVQVPIQVAGLRPNAPAYVTLAAVDEGILQLTRFQSPAPERHYYGKRRLGIDLRDEYARLLDGRLGTRGELRQGNDSPGGVGLPVVPTRTVALFSGLVTLDGEGRASVPLEVPDFAGQLRLMAVAFNADQLGRGETRLIVRDPVVADVSLPRFLAPGDGAELTLLIHNVEAAPGEYVVRLTGEGALALTAERRYTLAAGQRQVERLPIRGGDAGIGRALLALSGPGGLAIQRDWSIAIRPPHLPISLEQAALQPAGAEFTVDPRVLEPFVPGTTTVSLNYSQLRGLDVPSVLQSLDRYPYGCTEQITSRAFPLLMFNEVALLGGARQMQAGDLARRVQTSIDRVLERQDSTGHIGLWRAGDRWTEPWLVAYAMDFLTKAKERGYDVPDAAVNQGLNWLRNLVRDRVAFDDDADYSRGSGAGALLEAKAYAFYVLARAKAIDAGELRRFHDGSLTRIDSMLARADLGAALALMGDRARAANSFRAAATVPERITSSSYYGSRLRNVAGVVARAAEASQAEILAAWQQRLAGEDKRLEYTNTQEKAFMLFAAHALLRSSGAIELAVNGVVPAAIAGPRSFQPSLTEISAGFSVFNRSSGEIWRSLVVHGVPREAPPALSAGLSIEKTVLTLDGEPVELAAVKQNDRMLISLKGRASDRNYRQTVLVDPLPAGWEIESIVPATPEDEDGKSVMRGPPAMRKLPPVTRARVTEARDDRMVAAIDLNRAVSHSARDRSNGNFHIAYIVRAITPGQFVLPAAVIEDMYRPTVMGRTGAGSTIVSPR